MQAWTGLILWGEVTGNVPLRDTGIYLYTTELSAINSYWFDVEDRFFPAGYERSCAALLWGGKSDYATWFSPEPEHVHGIILLPIHAGSLYLGLYPEYVRRNLEELARLRGSDTWKHWHDILWRYEALADPGRAMERFEKGAGTIDPITRPAVYQWIGALAELGQVDRTVGADHPLACVFTRDGRRTYVVYTMAGRRRGPVRFTDGMTIPARPGGFTVATKDR